MSDTSDEVFFRVGGILHEARMEECSGTIGEVMTFYLWR